MLENLDQKTPEYGHFTRSVFLQIKLFFWSWKRHYTNNEFQLGSLKRQGKRGKSKEFFLGKPVI